MKTNLKEKEKAKMQSNKAYHINTAPPVLSRRERIYKNKYGFLLISSGISTLLFIGIYYFYILHLQQNIQEFGIILLISIVSSLTGMLCASLITKIRKGRYRFVIILRLTISSIIYAVFIYFGLYIWLWNYIPLEYIFLVLIAIKGVVFFIAWSLSNHSMLSIFKGVMK